MYSITGHVIACCNWRSYS